MHFSEQVDSLINFVVRLKVLLGEPKVDVVVSHIVERVDSLLPKIASEWQQCHIRTIYFEKIVSMCQEYNRAQSLSDKADSSGKDTAKSSSKAKSTPGGQSPGSKVEETSQLSASVLCACLDVFGTLAQVAPGNRFLTDNPVQVSEILASSFYFARKLEEEPLRAKLKKFVVDILTAEDIIGQIPQTVTRNVNVFIERALLFSEREYKSLLTANTGHHDAGRQGSPRSRSTSGDGDVGENVAALFTLEILNQVNKKKVSHFKPFTSALLSLLSSAVRMHSVSASTKQKQGGVFSTSQGGTRTIQSMYQTSTSGILAECSSAPQSGSRTSQHREPLPLSILKEFDGPLRTSVLILEILSKSDIVLSFTPSRKTFLHTLSTIFDSSNNIQLLMVSTRIVGRWLADPCGGPLTAKERNNFLWKISSFDYNGLPDVVAQPLSDLVAQYVISIVEKKLEASNSPGMKTTSRSVSVSDQLLVNRCMTACALNANIPIREKILSFVLSVVDDDIKEKDKVVLLETSRCTLQPTDLLWRLLQSDFEGLGGRNWLVLFVEVLLMITCCDEVDVELACADVGMSRPETSVKPMLPDLSTMGGFNGFSTSTREIQLDMNSGGPKIRKSLSLLAHADAEAARSLFLVLLPQAWESIPNDDIRFEVISGFESLLSRSFHSQFLKQGTDGSSSKAFNVVKIFIECVARLKPMPVLDVDLMVSLAESYSCWYEVLSILEQQFALLSGKSLAKAGKALHDKLLLAMRHCYEQLGEMNMETSLALSSCDLHQTHRAASFAIHGETDRAMDTYSALVDLLETTEGMTLSDLEMKFIEDGWVKLQRELCQTDVVSDYASSTKNPHLMLESAWKQRDWEVVRGLCSSPPLIAAVEGGDASVKICETLLAVANGKLVDVENLHAQTAQLCLYKWQLLPSFSHASLAHSSLLHFFHRLVEIRESGQIMVETSNHSAEKTIPDLKNLLK